MNRRLRRVFGKLATSARWLLVRWRSSRAHRKTGYQVNEYINRIISDAILFNEIPSPTQREERRVQFITRSLNDFGISDVRSDEEGNVVVMLPASRPTDDSILLFANIENEAYSPLDSLVKLTKVRASGKGIADNSLGAAALLVLSEYILKNDIRYDKNMLILFTSLRSSGSGFVALEHFLRHWKGGISAALYISGTQLGLIETNPLGACKLTVRVKTEERGVLTGSGAGSAVSVLSNISFQLGSIKWDEKNSTIINVAKLVAGIGYGYFPSEGFMELEIYSGDMSALEISRNAVCATIQKIAKDTGASIQIVTDSFVPVGNAERNRFLTEALRKVHGELGIRSRPVSTPNKTALLNAHGIPAIAVALTSGNKSFREEYVDLPPLETGFQQLILLLNRIAAPQAVQGP
jgi:tripeptide aminopeptidase